MLLIGAVEATSRCGSTDGHTALRGEERDDQRHGTRNSRRNKPRTLGVSRQTLVRMLDKGLIPFSRPSRHRRIRLNDLLEHERASRSRRDSSIRQMIAVGDDSALYDLPEPSPKEAAQAIAEVRRSQINTTIAFLDANIIYSITLTDTLLTMSEHNLLFPLWSPEVLLEAARAAERTLPASVQASFQ